MNNVVIVDDDEDLLRLLMTSFKSQGFEVKGFITGKEALDYLLDEAHIQSMCLLVLDRMLPDMDGLEVLRQLHEHSTHRVPVLILSLLSAEKDIMEGLQQGAVDYITKPFSVLILMQKARTLIRSLA